MPSETTELTLAVVDDELSRFDLNERRWKTCTAVMLIMRWAVLFVFEFTLAKDQQVSYGQKQQPYRHQCGVSPEKWEVNIAMPMAGIYASFYSETLDWKPLKDDLPRQMMIDCPEESYSSAATGYEPVQEIGTVWFSSIIENLRITIGMMIRIEIEHSLEIGEHHHAAATVSKDLSREYSVYSKSWILHGSSEGKSSNLFFWVFLPHWKRVSALEWMTLLSRGSDSSERRRKLNSPHLEGRSLQKWN